MSMYQIDTENSSELHSEMLDNRVCFNSNSRSGSPDPTIDASVSVVSIAQRTDALVRGLRLILAHHGARGDILVALNDQFHAYLDSSLDESVWLQRAKHALTYPLSKYLRNEPPAEPDRVFRPTGCLRGWMKARLNAFNRKNTHLWYSWLQTKRASLPVSDGIVKTTYEKHYASLTKKDPGDDQIIRETLWNPDFVKVLNNVKTGLMRKLSTAKSFVEKSASNSACYERTRGKGGQQGELISLCDLNERFHSVELFAMRYDPVVFSRRGIQYNVVTVIRRPVGGDDWQRLTSHANSLDLQSPVKCIIQAVLEPMKVRVISKGESLPYYTCRPLQHALHDVMRGMSCFRLIGRPFSPTDLLDLKKCSKTTDHWFSVDYSAATDGLSWKYSGAIFRYLCSDLDPEQYQNALRVLAPHDLYYPDDGHITYRGLQQNGQLMGSVLSFPILCLANLGVYLRVTEDCQQGWTLRRRLSHVLVNGDDMVYAADPSLWSEHVRVAEGVGLQMSVGKAYHHPVYANVNSTSVHCDLRVPEETPWQINYLNAGLFYGQHKVQDNGDDVSKEAPPCRVVDADRVAELFAAAHLGQDPERGLACNLNVLLNGCLPGKQSAILADFISEHALALRKECATVVVRRTPSGQRTSLATRNLFLPLNMGGMGVLPPAGFKFKVKPIQLQIAYSLLPVSLSTTARPLPGYEMERIESEVTVPWFKREGDEYLRSDSISAIRCFKRVAKLGLIPYGANKLAVFA